MNLHPVAEGVDMGLRRGMQPHPSIHRRRNEHPAFAFWARATLVNASSANPNATRGKDYGRSRARSREVKHRRQVECGRFPTFLFVVEVSVITGWRDSVLKRYRCYELLSVRRHDDTGRPRPLGEKGSSTALASGAMEPETPNDHWDICHGDSMKPRRTAKRLHDYTTPIRHPWNQTDSTSSKFRLPAGHKRARNVSTKSNLSRKSAPIPTPSQNNSSTSR